jgi:tetratricopeptide (TPR) repeat protein
VQAEPDAPDAGAIRVSARETLVRAGRRAASLALGSEAKRYFEEAADLTEDPVERAGLFEEAGQAAGAAGDLPAGRALLENAVELFRQAGRGTDAARSSARIADLLADDWRLAEALPLLERASAELAGEPPGEALATVAARIARVSYLMGDPERALEEADRALAIAQPLGLLDATVEALLARAVACHYNARNEEAEALLGYASALAERHGLISQALRGYFNRAYWDTTRGRYRDAADRLEQAQGLARQRGDRRWEQIAIGGRVTVGVLLGEWDASEARFEELIAVGASASAYSEALYPMAMVASARGDDARIRRLVGMAPEGDGSLGAEYDEHVTALHACGLRHDGRLEEALALVESVVAPWEGIVGDSRMWAVVELIESGLELGRREVLAELAERLESLPPGRRSSWFVAHGLRVRGHLDDGGGDREFESAAALLREAQVPFFLGQVLVEHAEARAAAGRAEQAAPLLAEAREIFTGLGATPWLDRVSRSGILVPA